MKTSRKVFAVLTVALPAMLLASMVRAEEPQTTNTSTCYSTERIAKEADYCKGKGGEYHKMSASVDGHDCVTSTKCSMPMTQPMMHSESSAMHSDAPVMHTDLSQSATVICKRTTDGNMFVFWCEDGKTLRLPMMSNTDMPKPMPMPPMPGGCSDIEMKMKYVKDVMSKTPSTDATNKMSELQKAMDECRAKQQDEHTGDSSSETSMPARPPMSPCDEYAQKIKRINAELAKNPTDSTMLQYAKDVQAKLDACRSGSASSVTTETTTTDVSATTSTKSIRPTPNANNSCQRLAKNVDGRKCTVLFCRGGREIANTLTCTK